MLVLSVATLFTFPWNAMSCAQVKGIQEIIKLIIGQKNIFLLKCCVAFWGYVHYLKSYLPSHLTLYHVSPTPGFMSPLGMVIFNSFPKASFSSASLSSLAITFNYSSTNWVPPAPPLTAVQVSATTFDLFVTVFLLPHQLFSWPWFF